MLRSPVLAALAALAVASGSSAQGTAASESGLVTAMSVPVGGGSSVGQVTGGQLSATVGQAGTGVVATSTNFRVESAVAWSAPAFTGDNPLVTGVRPAVGDRDGGELVTVFGFNFLAAGAGTNNVSFDGISAVGPLTTGNTQVRVTTPAGVDANDNPIVETEVEVSNLIGTDKAKEAFHFTPGLLRGAHAQLGRQFKIRGHAEAGQFYLLLFGTPFPPVTVPVTPFSGELILLFDLIFITPTFALVPADVYDALEIQMPTNLPLGFPLTFQALVIDNTFASGSWTNVLTAVIHADN